MKLIRSDDFRFLSVCPCSLIVESIIDKRWRNYWTEKRTNRPALTFSFSLSLLLTTQLFINRFWAITRPLRYRSLVNKRRLFTGIIIIWFASIVISFLPIFSGWYHDGSVSDDVLANDQMTDCSLKVSTPCQIESILSFTEHDSFRNKFFAYFLLRKMKPITIQF